MQRRQQQQRVAFALVRLVALVRQVTLVGLIALAASVLMATSSHAQDLPTRIELSLPESQPEQAEVLPTVRRAPSKATNVASPAFEPFATQSETDWVPAPPAAQRLWLVDDPEIPAKQPFEGWGVEPPHEGHILRQALYRKSVLLPGGNRLGLVNIQLEATLSPRQPLLPGASYVTPFFSFNFFDSSPVASVPATVYDSGVEVRRVRQWGERWKTDIAVAPAVFSDFENSRADAFRVVGRGVVLYDWSPTVQFALGAVYLGRDDVRMLPVAGVLWRPDEATEFDAVFPRPRFSRRFTPPTSVQRFSERPVALFLGFTPQQQYWFYVGGELGGNTWAVRKPDGTDSRFTYNDIRLVMGIEQRATEGPRGRIEVGYVFDRYVRFLGETATPLHDTIMLRGELAH